jgi:hypothetical protein
MLKRGMAMTVHTGFVSEAIQQKITRIHTQGNNVAEDAEGAEIEVAVLDVFAFSEDQ